MPPSLSRSQFSLELSKIYYFSNQFQWSITSFLPNQHPTPHSAQSISLFSPKLKHIQFLKRSCPSLTKLTFEASGSTYKCYDNIQVIMALSQNKSLQELEVDFKTTNLGTNIIESLFRQLKYVKILHISQIRDRECLAAIAIRCEKLEEDKQVHYRIQEEDIKLIGMIQNLRLLELNSLEVITKEVVDVLLRLPKSLRYLKIESPIENHKWFIQILSEIKTIEGLDLGEIIDGDTLSILRSKLKTFGFHSTQISSEKLSRFCKSNPCLEQLTIKSYSMGDQCLPFLSQQFPNLSSLTLKGKEQTIPNPNLVANELNPIFRNCSKLLSLTLEGAMFCNDSIIIVISNHLLSLQQLSISGLQVSSRASLYLRRNKQLARIKLTFQPMASRMLLSLFLNFKNLQYFQHKKEIIVDLQNGGRLRESFRKSNNPWVRRVR